MRARPEIFGTYSSRMSGLFGAPPKIQDRAATDIRYELLQGTGEVSAPQPEDRARGSGGTRPPRAPRYALYVLQEILVPFVMSVVFSQVCLPILQITVLQPYARSAVASAEREEPTAVAERGSNPYNTIRRFDFREC